VFLETKQAIETSYNLNFKHELKETNNEMEINQNKQTITRHNKTVYTQTKETQQDTHKSTWVWIYREFKATFKNCSVILWRSVLLVEKTGVPGENYGPAVSD
jgi:hypothetical protein